jgi:hypothetical protein
LSDVSLSEALDTESPPKFEVRPKDRWIMEVAVVEIVAEESSASEGQSASTARKIIGSRR